MSALNQLLQYLRIDKSKSLVRVTDSGWKNLVPYRLQKGLEEINPDRIYLQNEKPLILFFSSNDIDEKEKSRKIWNLGGAPIVIFIKNGTTSIYNGFLFEPENSIFKKTLEGSREIKQADLRIGNIISGKLWNKLSSASRANRVDEKLLDNIQSAQQVLIEASLDEAIANNLIGRLLFSRYLLDRGVRIDKIFFKDKASFLSLIKDKDRLYRFFEYLKENFNGDLFPLENEEKESVSEVHLDVLHNLFGGTEISTGQQSLFEYYDFNIIPVELISEVYERFMGKDKQRSEAAFYTPAFLVDYILKKTVKEKLKYSDTCRVLDPSCGSGIFLVETLRCIIEKNNNISKKELKTAVLENIFGVDKDENAVNLTIFSLYLTLLDYQEPKDISKFTFPNLKNKNIFVSDIFDLKNIFNTILENIELDYILGNPPWKSDNIGNSHLAYYKQEGIPVSDKQIAQTFAARVKDFSSENTSCALVLTSKMFYNHNAENFRKYLLKNFSIIEILELSPIRKHLFKSANAPAVVMFYRYEHNNNTNKNIVIHTSIKPNIFLKYLGLITIEKNDRKEIQQEYFQKYDWLWKVMLYGNVFDFYFLKRLKENYKTLNDVIDENNLLIGQGIQVGGGDKNDGTHLIGKKYLDTKAPKKALEQFLVKDKALENWEINELHRPRNKDLFNAPYVLIKKGFNPSDFSVVSAYSEKNFVFTDSITAINGKEKDKDILRAISGILNSNFFRYYLLLQGSSAGIERAQGHNKDDRFAAPLALSSKLSDVVKSIQALKYKNYERVLNNSNNEMMLKLKKELNEIILRAYNISQVERRIIDYALEVSIPLSNDKTIPYEPCSERQLEQYAKIFLDYFGEKWNGQNGKYLKVDIYKNDFLVGMNIKVIDHQEDDVNFIEDGNILDLLSRVLNIGTQKITDRFFLQRDIRGFQENSFYIIKANEYKNWHSAVAHVDLQEILHQMLDAEFENIDNND